MTIKTIMANDQSYDEIHDIKSKHPSLTEMNNDESKTKTDGLSSIINNNSPDISSIDINLEDYKKTISQISTDQSNQNHINDQANTFLFDDANESTQSSNSQNDPTSSIPTKNHHQNKSSIKTNIKSHKHTVQDHSLNEDNDNNNRQRSLSSSSSTSSSSTSSDNQTSNIPYETLYNDEDDDDLPEHIKETTNQISS